LAWTSCLYIHAEDRKFADIGNTVSLQYSSGVYKIASWAHITNAHTVPGEGIISGLKKVGQPLGRGLLLLAEMSSAGTLAKGQYSLDTVEMARRHQDFVIGFVTMKRINEHPDEDFLSFTPGVQLAASGDALGQQYRTPKDVILDSGCDIIIVGRGIYGDPERIEERAQEYRDAGWKAYLERCG
jgi:orotidine-5'-phosphate decarboxylase